MEIKYLLTVFLVLLIVSDHCQAFLFSLIPSAISGLISAFKGRRKRDLNGYIDHFKNFRKRDAELEELLSKLPIY
uniref:Peptide BmKb1 n=1 Tax=Olivierus martensii TaxID=34649 RepID=NDB43_OLIMR|nr:RecName: Full=Peptide BmKb1; AltName: Full=Antimicrobial peptide-like protein; AltName: Full=BmKb1'; AltName: Full=BmKb1*; AltName: Full=Non-disulfide-bridged peptide 4.2; Short=NDBP-4.2; AltName: Full=Non-disulfide-bridged peptide 4.3; Short=NDBP-4.3; AltName: Full=Toxin peptide 6; Flags: Precursor [Mesobuthus martensii]AAQ11422.1 anti-microbial peptide-like protein [Mesobuthus martensii]